ncbi:MAG TPA: SH3 domain-containing protein [Verrucomicrobiales bacterium]|nr:SH3 domain-containing protein [Verrucomicrobiales bacterium]
MIVHIKKDYTAQYPDAIQFEAGVPVLVVRGDADFPAWFWCRLTTGKEGWVHCSFLGGTEGGTVSTDRYSGKEITVFTGEKAILERPLDGWGWVKMEDGRAGWIPMDHML